jgi:hypothetical protein
MSVCYYDDMDEANLLISLTRSSFTSFAICFSHDKLLRITIKCIAGPCLPGVSSYVSVKLICWSMTVHTAGTSSGRPFRLAKFAAAPPQ